MDISTNYKPYREKSPNIVKRATDDVVKNGMLYLLALPGIVFLLMFCYFPMAGLIMVFKNYNFKGGIFGSPWVGFDNFSFFFSSFDNAMRSTWDTVMLNILFTIFGTIVSVAIAVMLNEVHSRLFVKVSQSIMFFPYFISWIIIGSILFTLLDYKSGFINHIFQNIGLQAVDWYSNPILFIPVLVICNIWQSAGYGSVIYFGVLTGFDPSYYEAAKVDGATRLQQIFRITIPMLKPTIIIMLLLSVGGMLKGNLGMIMGLTYLNPLLLPTTDIIDVFVYRTAVKNGDMGFASAISLYQSVFGFLLILFANWVAGLYDKENTLF